MFADEFVGKAASEDSDGGGIDLQHLVLIMENDALAGAFEERAELCFRFAQGALGAVALGVINDAGANQILAVGWKPQEADFGGNELTARLLFVEPLENRHTASEGFVHFFSGEIT